MMAHCVIILQFTIFIYFSLCWPWINQILLLARAVEELEAEKAAREEEKVRYLGEKLPPLQLSGLNMDDLQVSVIKDVRGVKAEHVGVSCFCTCITIVCL